MHWQFTPYVLLIVIVAVICAAIALTAWRRRAAPGATWLAFLMLAMVEWSFGYAMELGSVDLSTIVFWAKVEYLGIVAVSGTWLAFTLQYTGRGQLLKPRLLALLAIEPLTMLVLVWTNDLHGLIWSNTALDLSGPSSFLVVSHGAWFWVHVVYSYLLLLCATGFLIQALVRSPHLYKGQAGALVIGVLAPWVGNALFLSGLNPLPPLDLTSIAFTVTGLAVSWNLFRFRLLDIVPVARGALIESMNDALLVLDAQDRLVDLNPAAENLIGAQASEAIGQPGRKIFSVWPDLVERYLSVYEARDEITVGADATRRNFDLRISPLFDRRGKRTGRLMVLHDITLRKKAEEAVRQARDELETRVQARTADLANANAKLQAEIAERTRAEEEIWQRSQRQEALYRVSTELAQLKTPRELCQVVVRTAKDLLGYSHLAVFLVDPETGDRRMEAQLGLSEMPIDWRLHPGEGVSEIALLTGEMKYYPDVTREPRYIPGLRDAHSELDIPIKTDNSVLGVMVREDERPAAFEADDFAVLGAVASQLAIALENARMVDETQKSLATTTRLYELSSHVLTASTAEEAGHLVTETFRDAFGADVASIRLFDAQGRPEFKYSVGFSPTFYEGTQMRPDGLTLRAWKSGRSVIANDPALLHPRVRAEGIQSVIALPLVDDTQNLGVLYLNYRRPHAFSEREVQSLELYANQATLALKRVRLTDQARRHALEQTTISDIARALNAALNVHQAFPLVAAGLRDLTHCDRVSLTLLDENEKQFKVIALDPAGPEPETGSSFGMADTNTTDQVRAGRVHLTHDLSDELSLPAEQMLYRAGLRSRAILPLIVGDRTIGSLNLASSQVGAFVQAQLPVLEQIAAALAVAIENARLFGAEQTRREELTALYDLSRDLADTVDDVDALLTRVARHAVEIVHSTFVRIMLLNESELIVSAAYPARVLELDLEVGRSVPIEALPNCRRAVEHNAPVVLHAASDQVDDYEREILFLGIAQSLCLVPLRMDGRTLGVVIFGEARREEREPFTPEKIRLARSIGDQAASALSRAELFVELQQAYLQTVLALANAVDAKDTYTANHAQNMADLALAMGRAMGFTPRELETLNYAAILHDIGKIGIPDAILKKPSQLNAEEWQVMRRHPEIGERILAPIPRLGEAAKLVRHHHERYGGGGYPDGLAGEAIPLGARILTVVDTYSAIRDRRIYKPAGTHEQAVMELTRCAGIQFDPHIVDIFLQEYGRRQVQAAAVHATMDLPPSQ